MQFPKKFIHDKVLLLLASSNIFLACLGGILVLLNLGSGGSDGYIVEYRPNLGIGAFRTGSGLDMLSFICFGIIVATLVVWLSIRTYRVRRGLSLLILAGGLLLLLLSIITSSALIGLQ